MIKIRRPAFTYNLSKIRRRTDFLGSDILKFSSGKEWVVSKETRLERAAFEAGWSELS